MNLLSCKFETPTLFFPKFSILEYKGKMVLKDLLFTMVQEMLIIKQTLISILICLLKYCFCLC